MRRSVLYVVLIVMLVCLVGCAEEPSTTTTASTESTHVTNTTTLITETTTTTTATKKTTKTKKTTTTATVTTTTVCSHAKTSEATCTKAGVCEACGVVVTKALGHTFEQGLCTRCGEKSPDYVSRVEVLGIELEEELRMALVGDEFTLKYTLNPLNATDQQVKWTSSNPAVVSVNAEGELKAVSVGDATITVTSVNGKQDSCKVLVRDVAVQLPKLPMELRFSADYKKTVPIYVEVTGVEFFYTQTTEETGTLLMLFNGWLTYAADGDGHETTAKIGWRLYDSEEKLVTEGVAKSTELLRVGNELVGVSAEVTELPPGRYRLELYSAFEK